MILVIPSNFFCSDEQIWPKLLGWVTVWAGTPSALHPSGVTKSSTSFGWG